VIDKGFIGFAGQEHRRESDCEVAKLMKPFGELNRESTLAL